MKTMAQIDAWYEAELTKAKLQGEVKLAKKMISTKFQGYTVTEAMIHQLELLNDRQIDEFMVGMFSWQFPTDLEEWLCAITSVN
jgi:hypothetical protein